MDTPSHRPASEPAPADRPSQQSHSKLNGLKLSQRSSSSSSAMHIDETQPSAPSHSGQRTSPGTWPGVNSHRASFHNASPQLSKRKPESPASQLIEKRRKLDGKTLAANAFRASMASTSMSGRQSLGKSSLSSRLANANPRPHSMVDGSKLRHSAHGYAPPKDSSGRSGGHGGNGHHDHDGVNGNNKTVPTTINPSGPAPPTLDKARQPLQTGEVRTSSDRRAIEGSSLNDGTSNFDMEQSTAAKKTTGLASDQAKSSTASSSGIFEIAAPSIERTLNVREVDGPDDIRHMPMATDDRKYTQWRDHKGILHSSSGALIPISYELDKTFPGRHWICPIRSCRITYMQVQGLGLHFNKIHSGSLLNDNGDGTFTVTGLYKTRGVGEDSPLVVSKQAAGADAPQIAMASVPQHGVPPSKLRGIQKPAMPPNPPKLSAQGGSSKALPVQATATATPKQMMPKPGGSGGAPAAEGKAAELWAYIRPSLTVHKGGIPPKGKVREFLELPRVRDLKWNKEWLERNPFKDSEPYDVASLLVFLSGVEAPTPCNKCRDGKGPFVGCIMVSEEASIEIRRTVVGCANCYYHHQQTHCSHKYMGMNKAGMDPSEFHGRGGGHGRIYGLGSANSKKKQALAKQGRRQGQRQRQMRAPLGRDSARSTPLAGQVPAPSPAQPMPKPASTSAAPSQPLSEQGGELWKYVQSYLRNYKAKPPPTSNTISTLLTLPRVRDVQMNPARTFRDSNARDVTSLLLQVTGEESEEPCSRCLGFSRPYEGPCVLVPIAAPEGLHEELFSCAGCLYGGNQRHCSKKRWFDPKALTAARKTTRSASSTQPASTASSDGEELVESAQKLSRSLRDGPGRSRSTSRRSEPVRTLASSRPRRGDTLAEWTDFDTNGSSGLSGAAAAVRSKAVTPGSSRNPVATSRVEPRQGAARANEDDRSLVPAPALATMSMISPGNVISADLLEIEDWEAAPGQLPSAMRDDRPNILAVSKAYLSSPSAVHVWDDLALHVMTIPGATQHVFDVDNERTRVITLATGKLKVSIDGEEPFVIGPLGMFRVNKGAKCFVQNRLYVHAVVQLILLGDA